MSTHSDSSPPGSSAGPKRIKPHQLVIGIGCFMGLFTLVSGILPQITNWHDDKSPSREVFGGIPGALQVAFYTVIPVMLVWGAIVFADRVRNWERGAPDRRRTTSKNVKRRLADFRAGVYMRTLLRDSAAGVMHSMIYFG
ncbi:MAG TPA: iron-sulfur protein, partial [Ilumatobacteraceae bacterium]|nr:iron-sulfur protein [Ilumatobacteraceae bacterium]